ncbi:MAG: hypothetical protein HQK51_07665 [Oligoflexia bacterium]|nr:hypothetical protein [Oligoflexia bacterium]
MSDESQRRNTLQFEIKKIYHNFMRGKKILFLFIIILTITTTITITIENSFAYFKFGTILSSSTRGRALPGLYLGLETTSAGISLSSAGYNNTLGYFSAYQANAFTLFHPGSFLWGKTEIGLGLGLFYYKMGYKDNLQTNTSSVDRSNLAVGPAIRAFWFFLGGAFIGIETMLGIREPYLNLLLCFQDSTQVVAGISF